MLPRDPYPETDQPFANIDHNTDGVLGLHAEEEGGGEVVDLVDAGLVLVVVSLRQVLGLKVPVQPKGQMPDGGKTLQNPPN